MEKIKKSRIDSYIFGLLFFSVSLILFWKCCYGYAHLDEAFYPTIAYRFIQGDFILYDDMYNFANESFLRLSEMAMLGYSLKEVNSDIIRDKLGKVKLKDLKQTMNRINNERRLGLATFIIKLK